MLLNLYSRELKINITPDTNPVIVKQDTNTLIMPIRAVAEAFNFEVKWEPSLIGTQKIPLIKEGKVIDQEAHTS